MDSTIHHTTLTDEVLSSIIVINNLITKKKIHDHSVLNSLDSMFQTTFIMEGSSKTLDDDSGTPLPDILSSNPYFYPPTFSPTIKPTSTSSQIDQVNSYSTVINQYSSFNITVIVVVVTGTVLLLVIFRCCLFRFPWLFPCLCLRKSNKLVIPIDGKDKKLEKKGIAPNSATNTTTVEAVSDDETEVQSIKSSVRYINRKSSSNIFLGIGNFRRSLSGKSHSSNTNYRRHRQITVVPTTNSCSDGENINNNKWSTSNYGDDEKQPTMIHPTSNSILYSTTASSLILDIHDRNQNNFHGVVENSTINDKLCNSIDNVLWNVPKDHYNNSIDDPPQLVEVPYSTANISYSKDATNYFQNPVSIQENDIESQMMESEDVVNTSFVYSSDELIEYIPSSPTDLIVPATPIASIASLSKQLYLEHSKEHNDKMGDKRYENDNDSNDSNDRKLQIAMNHHSPKIDSVATTKRSTTYFSMLHPYSEDGSTMEYETSSLSNHFQSSERVEEKEDKSKRDEINPLRYKRRSMKPIDLSYHSDMANNRITVDDIHFFVDGNH